MCVDQLVDNGTTLVPNPFFGLRFANVRPLMDSRDYLNLLQSPGAVWQHAKVDSDTSNSEASSTNVSRECFLSHRVVAICKLCNGCVQASFTQSHSVTEIQM